MKLTSNNATVTANWAPVTYSVTYYANGGTGSVPVDSKAYTSGDLATALPNSGKLVKGSESFSGWNTLVNGNGRSITCGGKITMTANVSLYAQYSTDFVMDNDGNIYSITEIGGKTWMRQNLMTTKYNNGDPIPLIENEDAWKNLLGGAYCWPMNDSANKEYGALYNWYAVNTGNLAPAGWHVATQVEWAELNDSLGDSAYCKMIDRWSTYWTNPPECGTSYYVFTANANGCRECQGTFGIFSELPVTSGFTGIKEGATWWTSTEYFVPGAAAYFYYLDPTYISPWLFIGYETGLGVRCVKDKSL